MADGIRNPTAVLFREQATTSGHRIGIATLNSEKSLNALTLDMIRLLDPKLKQWAADTGIACVVIDGSGDKAFCAGGDVRSLRDSILAHPNVLPNPEAEAFFSEEYRLDHRIHTYSKPILVWGGGIVMGGGLGLLAGASHRVVTETSRIAMPEVTIGLYPDVGGSWFLPRMPGRTGLFLGLTGASMNASDALFIGLADFILRSADRQLALEQLAGLSWTSSAKDNHKTLSKALRQLAQKANEVKPIANVQGHFDAIQQLSEGDSLSEVAASITGYAGNDGWLKKAAAALKAGSPTSATLIWELWHRAKHLSLTEAFQMELIVSLQCCAHKDFAEGVRALLVDKDNKPNWSPNSLEQVSDDLVAEHLAAPWSIWANQSNPLADLSKQA